jgi:hypothetical protein
VIAIVCNPAMAGAPMPLPLPPPDEPAEGPHPAKSKAETTQRIDPPRLGKSVPFSTMGLLVEGLGSKRRAHGLDAGISDD